MPRALPILVLALALASTSCLGDLTRCDFADVEGMTDALDAQCLGYDWCFQDRDGDGWARVARLGDSIDDSTAVQCTDQLTASDLATRDYHFGDCDDTHPNRFPGNLEVCDNVDNDCNGELDFDEEDLLGPDGLPRCAPGRSVRLFVSGGSNLNGEYFGASSSAIEVQPGEPITGEIKLTAVIPDTTESVAVVAVASWEPDRASSAALRVILTPEDAPGEFDPESPAISFDGEFTVPQELLGENETLSIILAVADGGPVGGAHHLASLTHPRWCCNEEGNCPDPDDPVPCDPVWDTEALMPLPGEPPPELPPQLDLASLDELYLASCQTLGVARMPMLVAVEDPDEGDTDPCFDPLSTECQQIYVSTLDAGCVEIKLEIEEEDE